MRLEYDPESRAAYIRLRNGQVVATEEIAPDVMMDLAEDGRPVGFEFLDPETALGGILRGVEFILVAEQLAEASEA